MKNNKIQKYPVWIKGKAHTAVIYYDSIFDYYEIEFYKGKKSFFNNYIVYEADIDSPENHKYSYTEACKKAAERYSRFLDKREKEINALEKDMSELKNWDGIIE